MIETHISKEALAARVAELGEAISRDYRGKDLVLLGVLKGSFVFLADLARAIDLPLQIEFVTLSSYVGEQSSGEVRMEGLLPLSLEGKHVIVVEDIVDTGLTLDYLLGQVRGRKPASLRVCALLDKGGRRRMEVEIDYRGFEIEDAFVVGYGLDHSGRYRNLPFLGRLSADTDPSILQST